MTESLDALRGTFAMLREQYPSKLKGKIARLEDLWRRVVAAEAPDVVFEDLIQIAHNIVGTAETFGFRSAGEAAREIERCLQPLGAAGRLPDATEQERIAALLAALKSAAQ